MSPPKAFASKDPNGWWDILEVNIRGPYNFIQCGSLIYPIFSYQTLIIDRLAFLSLNCSKRKARWLFLPQGCPNFDYQMGVSTAPRSTRCFVLQSLLPLVNIIGFVSHSYWTSDAHCFVEYPDIKVFSVHPGVVKTDMYDEVGGSFPVTSTVGLAASTIQYLTSGKADYLNGRFVSSTWDLVKVERVWKEKIIAQNSLVSKLSLPV